ncbi:hypothetical protein CesoFtcFv8_013458 [Champsocephalus esox]|uniref:CxC3 like cysteine cluster domain-containing protein n=1 Tax=Champsocephalus esox TaxID=159716 RepID=A0AAN8GSK2_9TELE|nr:hypothetical protein CesoFtcFv8_013457 [Champsocephalus esox]KAK5889881.1 hypothetical protein CesoFtcFv8_013458 [Champsocephalus esox]
MVIDVLRKYVLCPDNDLKEDQSKPTAGGSQTRTMVWLEEDHDGQPMPKRRRTGEKRKRSSATGASRSVDLVCTPSTSGQESETGTTQSLDSLIQEVQELLGLPSEEPLSSRWKKRQASSLEKWTLLRPFMVNQMLSSEKPKEGVRQRCRQKVAVVTCQDCLPRPLSCTACDVAIHQSSVLHNRSSMVEGFLRPLSPSTHITEDEGGKFSYHERECFIPIMHPCCDCATGQTSVSAGKEIILIGINGRYNLFLPQINCTCGKTWSIGLGDLVESGYWPATVNFETLYAVDLFTTHEDLKITFQGECHGKLLSACSNIVQSSSVGVVRYVATHCRIDGNRKLYRFKSQLGPCGFFDGVFLAKDAEVSSFVDYIHGTTRHNPAKGRCDFELQNLLNMRPFLSIMHAHSWLCELRWGGRNQKGAGNTIGEEVEQVNSFLSRAAICSKYMSKAVRTDMLTIQASGWNKRKAANLEQTLAKRYINQSINTVQRITEATEDLEKITAELSLQDDQVQQWVSDVQQWTTGTPIQNDLQKTIEGLYLSIKQRKYQLYRQSGGNKRRHKLRKKIVEEKKALEDAITGHNAVAGEADKLPPPNELLAEDNYSWKWECHGDMVQKKKVYDKVMLLTKLKEEAVILVHEVKQHWEYMRSVAGKIDHLSSQLSEGITGQSSTEALTERGREGLLCVLKKQLHKVKAQQAMARIAYQCILGQQTVSLDDSSEEQPSDSSSSTDEEL